MIQTRDHTLKEWDSRIADDASIYGDFIIDVADTATASGRFDDKWEDGDNPAYQEAIAAFLDDEADSVSEADGEAAQRLARVLRIAADSMCYYAHHFGNAAYTADGKNAEELIAEIYEDF